MRPTPDPLTSRHLCATFGRPRVAEVARAARGLPAAVSMVELRADLLDPAEAASGAWRDLPAAGPRPWVFTWRSPEEGGGAPRPRGVWREALEAGFAWVDVEARELEAGDAEALALPAERRWVSRHDVDPPASPSVLHETWARLRRHPAALAKYVVRVERFEVNAWVLEVAEEDARAGRGPGTIFGQGWTGHVSRVLGFLAGNAVTYVAGDADAATAAGQPTVSQAVELYRLPEISCAPRLYGVLGNPARHSRSPGIHNPAFRRLGLEALYLPLEAESPDPVVAWMRQRRIAGLSVTAPFKERVVPLLDRLEESAHALGAVNTVWVEPDGRLVGANTDLEAARGLVDDMGIRAGDPVALLGAGGAARAVLGALAERRVSVTVWNRTPANGESLTRRLGAGTARSLDDFAPEPYRLLVNATPLGAQVPLPQAWQDRDWSGTAILDLAYGEEPSGWAALAARYHVPYRGGLEFLAAQARGQFRRWTGSEMEGPAASEGSDG